MNTNLTAQQKEEINVSAVFNEFVYQDVWSEDFKGKTLEQIMKDCPDIGNNEVLKSAIAKHPEIGKYELISQSNVDTDIPSTELIACAFQNPTTNDVYVAYRGTGDGKWVDNGEAFTKEASVMQERAREYFDHVVESNNLQNMTTGEINVTGHSKGGNSAQYVTMSSKYGDLIENCYSLDGQGFSKEAIEHFKEIHGKDYEKQLEKMYSINGENDYVHALGNTIIPDEHTYYIETTNGDGFAQWHELEGFFTGGEVNWVFTERGPIGDFASELSHNMMQLDSEDINDCAITIMSLLELSEEYHWGTGGASGGRKFMTWEEFIGFLANGIPTIIHSAASSEEIQEFIKEGISSFLNDLEDSKFGKIKVAGLAAAVAVATVIITPIAVSTWMSAYIQEFLNDIRDKIKELKVSVAKFCVRMGEIVAEKLEKLESYIASKYEEFSSWVSEGWEGVTRFFSGLANSYASLIQISPSNIHAQANTVRQYKKDQENYMAKLRRLVYSLDESWKGEAQNAFVAKFQSMESVYKQFSEVLGQYADLMDKAANEMQATDQDIKRMIQNI